MALSDDDIVLRSSNTEPNKSAANSFLFAEDATEIVKFRMDAGVWDNVTEDLKVRALVSAYKDIIRLSWRRSRGESQSRDYEFSNLFDIPDEPPLEDAEFLPRAKEAQCVQALYILSGTQVRDFARDGISMTRALSGSEMEIKGYRGAVCAEAKELLGKWIEIYPRTRRF